MLSFFLSLSMYMFTINQNMKVPFHLTKGSSLDLYAIVPGMSVVFSSTYNLNVTVSTKYSNLVYQSPEFSNDTNSTRRNLKSVNFGTFTGRIRVVALEDTYFVYETIRGEYGKNDSCIVKEEDFTAEEANKRPIPPEDQQYSDNDERSFPFPPNHQHPGDNYHNHPSQPEHQHPGGNHHNHPSQPEHHHPGDNNNRNHPVPPNRQNPGDHVNYPGKPRNGPGSSAKHNDVNFDTSSFSFDGLFDSIFSIIVSIGFIALFIALVVSIVRACKRNHNEVNDASVPPIIEQVDNFEQYIPPHNGNNRQYQNVQQPVQQIAVNYPQLQPMQPPKQIPVMIPAQQIQPNYYYQQPILIQHPMQQTGIIQGQHNPQ